MQFGTVIGIAFVLALIIGVGIMSGKKAKGDFLTGGSSGAFLVSGTIMGSLVSSQATIGTAQLAFSYGLSAWWYTLGSGIGCLVLGLVYSRPLRHSGCVTELQIIAGEYGTRSGSLSSVLSSIGIFISVLAQLVACSGLIAVLFPSVPLVLRLVASIAIMCIYVIFGGSWGTGMGGVIKLVLLYIASVAGLIFVLISFGGVSGIGASIKEFLSGTALGAAFVGRSVADAPQEAEIAHRFFSLISRGPMKDIGSGFSLLLGVLCTQTYAGALWSAKSDRSAKKGAVLSAFLIPPIGIAGISVGMFMRTHYITAAEVTALTAAGQTVPDMPVLASTIQVFPQFVMDNLPPVVAGIILGTLLITIVGGGAGLTLGMATILVKDIFKKVTNKIDTTEKEVRLSRLTIVGILVVAAVLAAIVPNSTINDFGFLSMGLRGTVVFLPMSCALWMKGRIHAKAVMVSVVVSPIAVIAAELAKVPINSLFAGLLASLICMIIGLALRGKQEL